MHINIITRNCGTFFYPNGYGLQVKHNGSSFIATMLKGVSHNYVIYQSESIGNIDTPRLQDVHKYIQSLKPWEL
jgi:hypothetical protein